MNAFQYLYVQDNLAILGAFECYLTTKDIKDFIETLH